MNAIEIKGLTKSFRSMYALDDFCMAGVNPRHFLLLKHFALGGNSPCLIVSSVAEDFASINKNIHL